MRIQKLNDMYELLKNKKDKKRLVVAYANDSHTIEAVHIAIQKELIEAILVGDYNVIKEICDKKAYDISSFKIVHEISDVKCAKIAVKMIKDKEADFIMKGLISTDKYMHAILNKESGLVPPRSILSHVTVVEPPLYHKLLIFGDAAVIPIPDLNQKKTIIKYLSSTAQSLGIECPKVAIIAPSEQVLPKIQSTIDGAILTKMGDRGVFGNVKVEGPLAIDIAIDKESADIKGIKSDVAGDADCLVFPNIESANVFYKTNTKFGNARLGAFIKGATVPCVLSSRGDSVDTKLNSIAIAALIS